MGVDRCSGGGSGASFSRGTRHRAKTPHGYGLARRIDLPDDGFAATFSALREYRLVPWVRTPEAMDVLLTRWLDLPIDGDDVEVAVMWPSRDVAMIPCSKAVG